MVDEILLAYSTFPDAETARQVAEQIVAEHLAACANILPNVHSIYHWQGKLETSAETMALFKTTKDRFAEFQARLKTLHPYKVPEIVATPLADGLPEYLRWVSESCASGGMSKAP